MAFQRWPRSSCRSPVLSRAPVPFVSSGGWAKDSGDHRVMPGFRRWPRRTDGIRVWRAQGARQGGSSSWTTRGVRSACVAWRAGLDLPNTVPDCTRFRITEPRGPEFHQGSTRGSTPAREHVRNLEGSERGIQALPRPRWSLFTGLFQFRHRGPSNWSARHSNDSLVAACTTTLDRQFLPQAPQIWQSQNVVEVRPRAWFRCQATGAGAQIWQDTLPELFDTTSAP